MTEKQKADLIALRINGFGYKKIAKATGCRKTRSVPFADGTALGRIRTERRRGNGFTLTYPVNYGNLPGVTGGDGEALDVYLLGEASPVREADCRVIGVVHRRDDAEDKLIAAPAGATFSKEEMAAAVRFQEQWFDFDVIALAERGRFDACYERGENGADQSRFFGNP